MHRVKQVRKIRNGTIRIPLHTLFQNSEKQPIFQTYFIQAHRNIFFLNRSLKTCQPTQQAADIMNDRESIYGLLISYLKTNCQAKRRYKKYNFCNIFKHRS